LTPSPPFEVLNWGDCLFDSDHTSYLQKGFIYVVYADECDRRKLYNNFIPIIDTALFSIAINRGGYNTAIVAKIIVRR
jgi:hypothetical protein